MRSVLVHAAFDMQCHEGIEWLAATSSTTITICQTERHRLCCCKAAATKSYTDHHT